MPPVSNTTSASSKSKVNRYSTSPDSEPSPPEIEVQALPNKKKKKNAASRQVQNNTPHERAPHLEVTREKSPATNILSQIPHAFSATTKRDNALLDVQDDDNVTTFGKISDQYTPPNDTWLPDDTYDQSPPNGKRASINHATATYAEPGFSTRGRYDSKSPPVSPPVRHVRPLSYGARVPPVPAMPRSSPSAYSYAPSNYGSPPAPHLPQQHFYHAQDIDLGVQRTGNPHLREEATLARYTNASISSGKSQHSVLLGFPGRLNIVRLEGGGFEEVCMLSGLSGTVIDAALLEWNAEPDPFAAVRPLIAVVLHGIKHVYDDQNVEGLRGDAQPMTSQPTLQLEYTTRVEVFSLSTQQSLGVLLETPPQIAQSAYKGATPTPPDPIGHLKLHVSGAFLTVVSGVSGEVYAFTVRGILEPVFDCLGKFWTNIQPQIQRRDSSHQRTSDADISPADIGRAGGDTERAVVSLNSRWLAISPASISSRPSLGALLGSCVSYGRHSGIENTSAPTKPSVTCEVDSPDVDTLFSRVARGVAQEFVKSAKWLGDQGYQTWQSYWKKEQLSTHATAPITFSPALQPTAYTPNAFPPTHGEASRPSKDPELVAIYDLQALHELSTKRGVDELKPLATFQPPRGCSYLSFAPHGLSLLTAGRKGDVQYVWDLMQIKYCRTQITTLDDERMRIQPRVRQIAKYERLSGSTIVDVVWDMPAGSRFAVLTKNKTIHLFDLPLSALRWPPARYLKKTRPMSSPIDNTQQDTPIASGFFASAMNIANQAQPIISGWRGRAPSMGGGLAGIGQTGIGFASATGVRSGKVVAAGLSKSLGAASETVNQLRHAGENRLHLKSNKDPLPDRTFWLQRGRKSILVVLDTDVMKQYQVRRSNKQEKRDKDNGTVFAASKGVLTKLPPLSGVDIDVIQAHQPDSPSPRTYSGFLKTGPNTTSPRSSLIHPLSFAEIETNVPYQPFHSDRRVTMSVYTDETPNAQSRQVTASTIPNPQPQARARNQKPIKQSNQWVFGDDIPTITLNISKLHIPDDEDDHSGSIIYRETTKVTSPSAGDDDMDQIVSTTRRRKIKKAQSSSHHIDSDVEKDDGFFEDDCDVLDFATDRV